MFVDTEKCQNNCECFIFYHTRTTEQDVAADNTLKANTESKREPSKKMPIKEAKYEVESLNCCSGMKEERTELAEESMQSATVDHDSGKVVHLIDASVAQRDGSGESQTVVDRHAEVDILDNYTDKDCSSPDGEGDSQPIDSMDLHSDPETTNPRVSECKSLSVIYSQKKQTDWSCESSPNNIKREDALKSLLGAMPKTFCATDYDRFARKERCKSASAIIHDRPPSGGQSSGRPSSVKLPNDRPSSGRSPPDWPCLGWPTPSRPLSGRPSSGRPSSERPSSGRPSSGRSTSGRLSSSRPSSGRPSSGRSSSGRSSSGRPSSGRPSSGRKSSGRTSSGKSRDSHYIDHNDHRPSSATKSVQEMLMENLLLEETAQKKEAIPGDNVEKIDLFMNQNTESEEAFLTQIGLRQKLSIQRKEAFLNHCVEINVVLHQENADKKESFMKSSRRKNDVVLEQNVVRKKSFLMVQVEKKALTEQNVERKDVSPRKNTAKRECVVVGIKKENQHPCAGGKLKLIVNVPHESYRRCPVTLPKNPVRDKPEIVGRPTQGKFAYTSMYNC